MLGLLCMLALPRNPVAIVPIVAMTIVEACTIIASDPVPFDDSSISRSDVDFKDLFFVHC